MTSALTGSRALRLLFFIIGRTSKRETLARPIYPIYPHMQRTQMASGYATKNTAHMMEQPPSLCPPLSVVVLMAVLQMSSNAGPTSSPVTAEHST